MRTGLLVAREILLLSDTLCPLSSHPNLMPAFEGSMKSFTSLGILKMKKCVQSLPQREKHNIAYSLFNTHRAAADRSGC